VKLAGPNFKFLQTPFNYQSNGAWLNLNQTITEGLDDKESDFYKTLEHQSIFDVCNYLKINYTGYKIISGVENAKIPNIDRRLGNVVSPCAAHI